MAKAKILGFAVLLALLAGGGWSAAADKPPIYIWLEPEWFEGVQGSFSYWTGEAKPTGAWGIAGPGISAEWTQGGESEWNSMGAPAAEAHASCRRDFQVPRTGKYRVWVRYVEHRQQTQPFTVGIVQGTKAALRGELGIKPVVPPNDEYQLYWGFSFGWGALEADLTAGPARLTLSIDKAGQAWRQIDAVLITDDMQFAPVGREKPPFGYLAAFQMEPKDGAAWRGSAKDLAVGKQWRRPRLAGRDFTMWTSIEGDAKWWGTKKIDTLSLYDIFFQVSPPGDIRLQFYKHYAGRKDVPIISWPNLVPGLYLATPDLSPGTPLRQWLERTRTPFYILTNYANPQYDGKTGPATYAALAGPLAGQFLGYIHGEAIGTVGVGGPDKPLGKTRREHLDAFGKQLLRKQAEAWTKIYQAAVPESYFNKSISCLSVDSIALAHEFHELGAAVVGYEEDSTNVHVPMRIAFERGAARQYGQSWLNYASGNFGDACNYFTQEPTVPRGAPGWFHSKYAITDGVSAAWYRKMYYLNYLSGAAAIFWEQSLGNQWIQPGPGKHPVQLSPFGRATVDFQGFVDRLPDRGQPYTPVAVLLNYGHGYDRVNYACKMLNLLTENEADRELRELFNVCWYPSGVLEGMPAAPDVQSLPSGIYGNIFDVLVDRPQRAKAIDNYPVVWAAGDVDLAEPWPALLEDYVKRGGTLVVNVEAARGKLPSRLLGFVPAGITQRMEEWTPEGGSPLPCTPYLVERGEVQGAKVLAWAAPNVPLIVRNQVGAGAVVLTLVPRMIGLDERAHPALPYLMNGITDGLLPVQVRLAGGARPRGEIMYQINKTKDGYLVALLNNRGIDKTQSGVARVDRRQFADVVIRTRLPLQSAREYSQPRDLPAAPGPDGTEVQLRVHPGDVQVVYLVISK
jgi:hypothetical protein